MKSEFASSRRICVGPKPALPLLGRSCTVALNSLHRFVRTVDNRCAEVEQKRDLSPDWIAHRRTELGRQALIELASFKPFEIAEQAASNDIDFLKRRDDLDWASADAAEDDKSARRAAHRYCGNRACAAGAMQNPRGSLKVL
jgi:hypothetical protein